MREDQFIWGVTVDGRDLGFFDKGSGGEVDSEETKYKPAGLPHISLGGSTAVGNVTLQRLYQLGRDDLIESWLMSRAGRGQVTLSKQRLDRDSNPSGKPTVYTGVLKTVTPPDTDSESSSAAMLELEVSSSGTVA